MVRIHCCPTPTPPASHTRHFCFDHDEILPKFITSSDHHDGWITRINDGGGIMMYLLVHKCKNNNEIHHISLSTTRLYVRLHWAESLYSTLNSGFPFSTMSCVNTAHAQNTGPWRRISWRNTWSRIPTSEIRNDSTFCSTNKRAHRTLLWINHQKDECPEKVLDLSFLGNEIVFIEKVPHNKYNGCTDPKVLFEEPVLHDFRSDATAAPVLYVPCELATIVISSSTRDPDPGRYQYHCRPWWWWWQRLTQEKHYQFNSSFVTPQKLHALCDDTKVHRKIYFKL